MSNFPFFFPFWAGFLSSEEPTASVRSPLEATWPQLPAEVDLPAPSAQETPFLQKLHRVLESKLGQEDFDVSALSQAMAMSRMHLHRKMKALTGQSPGQYLRRQRLLRAQHLLRYTHYSVGEIALMVGFKEHANFTRAYKQEFGRLPKER